MRELAGNSLPLPDTQNQGSPSGAPATKPFRPRIHSPGRLPAASVGLALAAGIFADRHSDADFVVLAVAFFVIWTVWFVLLRNHCRRAAAACVLFIAGLAGAAHHHLIWDALPGTDIERLLPKDATLIRCEGIVVSEPTVFPPKSDHDGFGPPPREETKFRLRVQSLAGNRRRVETSGVLSVIAMGTVDSVHTGDRIEIQGWARRNRPIMNPGGYDSVTTSRRYGIRGWIKVDDPALIRRIESSTSWLDNSRRFLRHRAEAVLESGLTDDVRSVGDAMLLGDRSLLHRDLRARFVESGTMHLLAISGLHIGILMLFLFVAGRAIGLSMRTAVVTALLVLFLYLQIADCRPPMVRAFVIILIGSLGRLFRRQAFSANSLAAAAIVILAMNPTSLFDVGSQLSFLAVAVIFWLLTVTGRDGEPDIAATSADQATENVNADSSAPDALQIDNFSQDSPLSRLWFQSLTPALGTLGKAWAVSGAIWIISAPLVLHVFNVVAPVGLLINVLLIPIVGTGLSFGFMSILAGLISTTVATPFVTVFGWFLRGLMGTVDLAAGVNFGHAYLPEPPFWWLCGFYGIVAITMVISLRRRSTNRVWLAMSSWILFGLTLAPHLHQTQSLKCTFLSVGHGLSIIVQTPSGKTLVYDAGSRGGGRYPAEVVSEALWAQGASKIDAMVITHADADHYSGVIPLTKFVPVGRVFCSHHFAAADQESSLETGEVIVNSAVPLDFIADGDRIAIDPEVSITVLHPTPGVAYQSDNAASVVLQIDYQDSRILLTGDLDDDGAQELLQKEPRNVDVLLAPHHGEPDANPRALAEWANPKIVVASSARHFDIKPLLTTYGPTSQIFSTSDDGAVTVTITPNGQLDVQPFVSEQDVSHSQR